MRGEGGAEIVEGKFRKLVLFQDAPVGVLGDRKEAGGLSPRLAPPRSSNAGPSPEGGRQWLGWGPVGPAVARTLGWPLLLSTMAPQDLEAGAPRHAEADMQTLRRQAAWPCVRRGTLEVDFPPPLYR